MSVVDSDRHSQQTESQTFVFADLAGYTALTEAHGDEHAADAAAEFCAAVRTLLDQHGAEEVKAIGDAKLVRVSDPDQAVRLAARIVSGYGARHRTLGIRVGVHTGTAVRRGEDWFGSAVNLASRVADLAGSGEVLLTDATRQALGAALAVVEWVGWFNSTRLHESLGDLPPLEFELINAPPGVALHSPSGLAPRDPDPAVTLTTTTIETQ